MMVDYGSEYNKELYDERELQRKEREVELDGRRNRNHNFTCSKCGHSCNDRYRLKHYNLCSAQAQVE